MGKGPNGERRRGDTLQQASQVARIATGQERDNRRPDRSVGGLDRVELTTKKPQRGAA